jgi:hypothetical protein
MISHLSLERCAHGSSLTGARRKADMDIHQDSHLRA